MNGPVLLLVGATAMAQAPRLELSGYRCREGVAETPGSWGKEPRPQLVVLAGSAAGLVAELQRQLPGVPVLLDIERDSVAGRADCLCAGANDFWISSAGTSDLLGRLRLHLQRDNRLPPDLEQLVVADLSVVPSRHEVRRGNRALELTAREYALLVLLMRHAGQVLSRGQILAEVWHDQRGAASNVIEVYVRYLRQKLEQGGERRLIHTVRGQGYCLREGPPRPGPRA